MSKKKSQSGNGKPGKALIEKAKTDRKNLWIGAAIIAAVTFLIYFPVFSNGFVNLDDDRYIEKQQLIRSFNFGALFTTNGFVMGNYHPLVMSVYTILYHFFKFNPDAYHTVNLILHIINSCLVMWLFFYLTGKFQLSFVVGLLFGIHPLHVESVAWASELKDLMYTLGFLSSLIFYVRYVKEKQAIRLYVFSFLFFLFSLLSKGMGVSLTAVLFLIDFYLGRKFTSKTIFEKIPFFILSLVFGVVAIFAQKSLGAIQEIELFSFTQRIVFACYGFITYIERIFVPLHLCAYYPYPVKTGDTIPGVYYVYPFILAALLAAVFYSMRKTKKVFFGIGFFAVTVFLVLQLLPVGGAITADRYSYIPSIGIFFLIAEALLLLPGSINSFTYSNLSKGMLVVMMVFFSFLTFNQVKIWKDGMTMWSNVIDNYQTVSLAYNNRGVLYKNGGQLDKAMDDYQKSLVLNPKNADTWSNMGLIFWQQGNAIKENTPQKSELYSKAMEHLNKALELDPDFSTAYSNRGSVLYTLGQTDEALKNISRSIELDPYFAESYYNRGIINYNLGRNDVACADLKRGAELGYEHCANAYRDLCMKK